MYGRAIGSRSDLTERGVWLVIVLFTSFPTRVYDSSLSKKHIIRLLADIRLGGKGMESPSLVYGRASPRVHY